MAETSYKVLEVYHFAAGICLCSFSKDDGANFLVKKKCNEAFRNSEVSIIWEYAKQNLT